MPRKRIRLTSPKERGYREKLKEVRADEVNERNRLLNSEDFLRDEFDKIILEKSGEAIKIIPPYTDPDPPKPFRKRHFIKLFKLHLTVTAVKDLLTIAEIRVLLFILARCGFNNEFIYHSKNIANELNLAYSTVSRALKKLVNLGYIRHSEDFIGYQIYSLLSWKGSDEDYEIYSDLEFLRNKEESYQRKQRGEIDKYGYDIPPEEKKE